MYIKYIYYKNQNISKRINVLYIAIKLAITHCNQQDSLLTNITYFVLSLHGMDISMALFAHLRKKYHLHAYSIFDATSTIDANTNILPANVL